MAKKAGKPALAGFFNKNARLAKSKGERKIRPFRMVVRALVAAGLIAGAAYAYAPKSWEQDAAAWPSRAEATALYDTLRSEKAQATAQGLVKSGEAYGYLRATSDRKLSEFFSQPDPQEDAQRAEVQRLLFHYMGLDEDFTAWYDERFTEFKDWLEKDLWQQETYDNWKNYSQEERLVRLQVVVNRYFEIMGGETVPVSGFEKPGFYYPFVENVAEYLEKNGPITADMVNDLRAKGILVDFAVESGNFSPDHLTFGTGDKQHLRIYPPAMMRGMGNGKIHVNMHKDADFMRYPSMLGSVVYQAALAYSYQLVEKLEKGEIGPEHPAYQQARIFRFNQVNQVDPLEWPKTYLEQPFMKLAQKSSLEAEYKAFHGGRLDRETVEWEKKQTEKAVQDPAAPAP